MSVVTLPDGPSHPRFVQGGMALAAPLRTMRRLCERYGSAFTIDVPIFGKAVVISDAAEVKQLFTTSPEIADNLDLNMGRVLGPNSFFAIRGDAHKQQRVRPVIDRTARQVRAPSMRRGRWILPEGQMVLVSIYLIHSNEALFPKRTQLRPGPLRGQQAGHLPVDPFRRRHAALHRRCLRPHGDEHGAAHAAPRFHSRADQ